LEEKKLNQFDNSDESDGPKIGFEKKIGQIHTMHCIPTLFSNACRAAKTLWSGH